MNLTKLKEARKARKLTQADVAKLCDMSAINYARLESGRAGTTIATMDRVARVLGLRLELVEKGAKVAQSGAAEN